MVSQVIRRLILRIIYLWLQLRVDIIHDWGSSAVRDVHQSLMHDTQIFIRELDKIDTLPIHYFHAVFHSKQPLRQKTMQAHSFHYLWNSVAVKSACGIYGCTRVNCEGCRGNRR